MFAHIETNVTTVKSDAVIFIHTYCSEKTWKTMSKMNANLKLYYAKDARKTFTNLF